MTIAKESETHLTKDKCENLRDNLRKGSDFLEEYKNLCLKHKMFVEAGCGYPMLTVARKQEIDQQIEQLKDSLNYS